MPAASSLVILTQWRFNAARICEFREVVGDKGSHQFVRFAACATMGKVTGQVAGRYCR